MTHPDQAFVRYLLSGLSAGFCIGFAYTTVRCLPATSNHTSANEHPAIISEALEKETSKGCLKGPLNPKDFPYVHISSLGAIPKKNLQDTWHLILDLSHPKGSSVNEGIAPNLCSLSYVCVDDVVQHVLRLGTGCLLAKIDIESVFRNIPVHPHDRHLLGMRWNNHLFIDTALPFGLCFTPKIFNSIADALQQICKHQGISFQEHFLDVC